MQETRPVPSACGVAELSPPRRQRTPRGCILILSSLHEAPPARSHMDPAGIYSSSP